MDFGVPSSKQLKANAMKPPVSAKKGGAFQSNAAGSGSDKAADAPGEYDGGLSGGVLHSAQQEQNIQDKATSGRVIGNDDLDYMGHFANDEILHKGHNTGMKSTPQDAHVKTARSGFRKLSGTAVNQIGHARYGEAETGLLPPRHIREQQAKMESELKRSRVMGKNQTPFGVPEPIAISDVKLSKAHHRDSIAFHTKHIKDHESARDNHKRMMNTRSKQLRGKK